MEHHHQSVFHFHNFASFRFCFICSTRKSLPLSFQVLKDLKTRLANTRPLTPPLEGIQQQYGFNTNTLKEIINYWKNDYNWRQREKHLNQFPQFTTSIQGLNIHFIHAKPSDPGVKTFPLLIAHGWPGTVVEFYKIIPLLTKYQEKYGFAFEVIAPSLPGYAFSDGASKPGLGTPAMAPIFRTLMKRLGFDEFYVQGGDWGSYVVKNLATLYPDNVLGLHTNMGFSSSKKSLIKVLLGALWPSLVVDAQHEHLMYPLSSKLKSYIEESGYFHLQATKPDTIGMGGFKK